MSGLRFAFFGSSLVSAYWNGACTYYRGLLCALHARGHRITFYEPHAYDRQEHRDIADPDYARVIVYEPDGPASVRAIVRGAREADVVVKTSGVGVYDEVLEAAILELPGSSVRVFWDVDAPATLAAMRSGEKHALRGLLPEFDAIFTYGGGPPVVDDYLALGARQCLPVYNALDAETHHPVEREASYASDLTLLANRLPDREARIEEFFFRAAALLPERSFLLGGNGWLPRAELPNLRLLGHVAPGAHNAVNCSARAVLNVSRESMARNGFSPATRVFEAAGAGACLISDRWEGIEQFLEPGQEVLLADDGAEVAAVLEGLDAARARRLGEAARERVLQEHTYRQRAAQVEQALDQLFAGASR